MGTKDDGWESPDEVMSQTGLDASLKDKITTTDRRFVRVVSNGEVQGVRSAVACILDVSEDSIKPVFWREEIMK